MPQVPQRKNAPRNVVLTDHQTRLVERLVAEHEARLRALREAAAAGIADIDGGDFRSFDAREPLRDHLRGLATEAIADRDSDSGSG